MSRILMLLNNNLKDCPQKSGCYNKPFSRVIENQIST